jgi:hypothetical protein
MIPLGDRLRRQVVRQAVPDQRGARGDLLPVVREVEGRTLREGRGLPNRMGEGGDNDRRIPREFNQGGPVGPEQLDELGKGLADGFLGLLGREAAEARGQVDDQCFKAQETHGMPLSERIE